MGNRAKDGTSGPARPAPRPRRATPPVEGAADKWIPKLSMSWPGIDGRAAGVGMPRMLFRLNEFLPKDRKLHTADYAALLVLAQARSHGDGIVRMSHATMGRRLGVRAVQAARSMKALAEAGFLAILPPDATHPSAGYDLGPTVAFIGTALEAYVSGVPEPPEQERRYLLLSMDVSVDRLAAHVADMRRFTVDAPEAVDGNPLLGSEGRRADRATERGTETEDAPAVLRCRLTPRKGPGRNGRDETAFTAADLDTAVGMATRLCREGYAERSGRPTLLLTVDGKRVGSFRVTMTQKRSAGMDTWVSYRADPPAEAG